MKVCILTNILAPYRIRLFEELNRRVASLTVLLMAQGHANRQWTIPAHEFNTVFLPGMHIATPNGQDPMHFNTGVMAALRSIDPDVVISGGYTWANIAAFMYCKRYRRAHVSWGELTLRDGAERSAIRRLIRRLIIANSQACIASSTVAQRAFAHYGAPEHRNLLSVMPIDVEFFRAAARRFRATDDYAQRRSALSGPVLISVGRLTDIKGYDELFTIYARVLNAFPAAKLLIVGDGPRRADYEKHVASRGWSGVEFLGFLEPDALVRAYCLADVFVFHTRHDPFGAVLSEAMACRTLAISSVHAAATHDLVEHGTAGFAIDPLDADAAAACIIRALTLSEGDRRAMLDEAEKRVGVWTFERAAEDIATLLRTMVGPNAGDQQMRQTSYAA